MTTQQIARLDALIAHFRDLVIAYMEAGDRPAAQRALGQHERLKALRVEILAA